MGLIKCPECGNEVSDKAQSCPKCGAPIIQNTPRQVQRKKRKGPGCLVTVLIFVVLITIISVMTKQPETKNSTDTETVESKQQSDDKAVALGQEGKISDELELVVNSVTETDSISAANGVLAYHPDSGKYAVVNVTIKNASKESQQLLLNYFKLIGPDDAKYVSTIIAAADDKYITVDTINPNLDITGNIVFEIPQDLAADDCVLQYSDFDFTNEISYFYLK